MRNLSFFLLLLIIASCQKTEEEVDEPYPPIRPRLGGSEEQLKRVKAPVGDAVELGHCRWQNSLPIKTIDIHNPNPWNKLYFTYQGESSFLATMERRSGPSYTQWECTGWQETFYCNAQGQMDSIMSTTCGGSSGHYNRWIHRFSYYPSGALKSVIRYDTSLIQERYFSYNDSGQVEMMLWGAHEPFEPKYRFLEQHFKYDASGNVIEITCQHDNSETINEIYTFTYDNKLNIWKGIFFPTYRNWISNYELFCAFMLSNNNPTHYSELTISSNRRREFPLTYEYEGGRLMKLKSVHETLYLEY